MARIYTSNKYVIIDEDEGIKNRQFSKGSSSYKEFEDHFLIESSIRGTRDKIIGFLEIGRFNNELESEAYTEETMRTFLQENLLGEVSVVISENETIDSSNYVHGFQDFADSITASSPIQQTNIEGGTIDLTNDAGGVLTDGNTNVNSSTTLKGDTDTWNSNSNTIQFNDTGLKANDNILYRIHLEISPNIVPLNMNLDIDFYTEEDAGGSFAFSLRKDIIWFHNNEGVFKTRIIEGRYFLGESIINGSAKIKVQGDSAFECKVVGFNRFIIR